MEYDIVFLHPPSMYDFRRRPFFPGPISKTVHFTPAFEGIPIGLISMAEYAERSGYKVKIFNIAELMATSQKFDPEEFIKNIKTRFFGIDLHFCVHSQGALEVAKMCKNHHKDSDIIIGGLTATRFANEIMEKHSYVDYVITGEGEVPLLNILETGPRLEIPNLIFRDKDQRIIENKHFWIAKDFNEFDFTRIDLVTPRKNLITVTTEVGTQQHWMIPVCRGCIFNCATCGGSKYAYSSLFHRDKPIFRSKEKIVEDLQKLSEQGIESVFLFMDPRMGGKKYWGPLFKTLASEDIGVKYLNIELFTPADEEYLSTLNHLNNKVHVSLTISPESGSEMVRIAQGRQYTTDSLMKTARSCRTIGLGLVVFFMFGLAQQTKKAFEDTYRVSTNLMRLNFESGKGPGIRTQFGEMLLMDPGSLAFENPEKYNYNLIFRSLQDYIDGMSSPSWTDWLSYETNTMKRKALLESPITFREQMINFYHSVGLVSQDQAEQERKKLKIDRNIINELESIRDIVETEKREKRYWALYRALEGYNLGKISLLWKIKRKLGILGIFS